MRNLVPALLCAMLGACATQRSLVIVPATLGPQQEEVVGVVSGSSMADYYPIVSSYASLRVEGDSLKAAFEDALKGTGAHTLINVTADKRCRFVPFPVFYIFARCRVGVSGTAVRYTHLAAPQPPAAGKKLPAAAAVVPVVKAPPPAVGAFTPAAGASAEAFYDELSKRYDKSLKEARRFYKKINAENRSRLEAFVVESKGRISGGRRRFLIDKSLSSEEKNFLLWYMSSKTKYRAVLR